MKYTPIFVLIMLFSCKAQSQTVQWKEPECMCKIDKDIEKLLMKELGADSFNKIQNQILIRYAVAKTANAEIQILKNNGNYISNARFVELAKRLNYDCIFQLFPDQEKIIIPFSKSRCR